MAATKTVFMSFLLKTLVPFKGITVVKRSFNGLHGVITWLGVCVVDIKKRISLEFDLFHY